jgi:hypothetical protein
MVQPSQIAIRDQYRALLMTSFTITIIITIIIAIAKREEDFY